MAVSKELYAEKSYKEGYVPSSLDSQHSSLHRTATWVGMGMWLTLMAALGTFVFGLATWQNGTQDNGFAIMIGGIIAAVTCVVLASVLVHTGRKNYREYVKRTGRIH